MAAEKKLDVRSILKKEFDEADVEKKGSLTVAQTKEVLERILEFKLEDRLTNRIIKLCDVDGSGNINFDEFCTSAKALVEALMEISREFHRVDVDESGYLSADEVAQMLTMGCGGRLSTDDHIVRDFIASVDKDGDGRISFHEYIYFTADHICRHELKK